MPDKVIVAAGKAMDEKAFVSALQALMGLDPDVTLEALLSAVGKVLQGKDPNPEPAKPPEPPAPPAAPDAPPAPMDAPAAQASANAGRLMSALGAKTVDEAVAQVIRYRTEFVPRSAAPSQVAVALAEARISHAEAEGLKGWENADPDGLRAYLGTSPPHSAVPTGPAQAPAPGSVPPLPPVAKAEDALSPEDQAAIEAHGLTPEAFKAARKAMHKKLGR